MTALDIFTYSGQQVRTVIVDGEPWFVAADVAGVLGYVNVSAAITAHCKGVANHYPLSTPGGMQQVRIISEPDMLRLIVNSKLPAAEQFEQWVFEDVLPQIRKTGRYGSDVAMLAALPASKLLSLAAEAAERAEKAELELESARPKVAAFDGLMDADGLYSMEEVAKAIGGIGRNNLYKRLREAGVIEPSSTRPYQRYMQHFALVLGTRPSSRGDLAVWTTKVRPSGLPFILSVVEQVSA